MLDIRSHIIARTYSQCLKLLKEGADVSYLKESFPPPPYSPDVVNNRIQISAKEDEVIGVSGFNARIMDSVHVGDINIVNLESNPNAARAVGIEPPALILDFCITEEIDDRAMVDSRTCNQMMGLIVRAVLPRENVKYDFLDSNIVKTMRIREALSYLLDASMFRNSASVSERDGVAVVNNRPGYQIPSKIWDVRITGTNQLGVIKDKFMVDYLVTFMFYEQKETGEYAVNSG